MPPRPPHPRPTHFLSIPLVTNTTLPQLQASFQRFRRDAQTMLILNTDGLDPGNLGNLHLDKAIRPAGTIHLTLGVMTLLTEERVKAAVDLLHSLDIAALFQKHLPYAPEKLSESDDRLDINLRGLSCMEHASKTSILYISPTDPHGHLLGFCQEIRNIFQMAALVIPDTRPLLLHATVFNTTYMPKIRGNGNGNQGSRKSRGKTTVDARDLIFLWKDRAWAEGGRVEKIAVCRMGAQKVGDSEEYIVEGERGL